MRAVGYVRSVCEIEKKPNSQMWVKEQEDRIRDYCKNNNFVLEDMIVESFDAVEDETAFLDMKQDILKRKYDVLIICSVFYCGRNITSARDLLETVMAPAGIRFVILEDEFDSQEKTEAEIATYFQNKHKEFYGKVTTKYVTAMTEKKRYNKYGYIYSEDGSELMIDKAVAPIINRIFSEYLEGKSLSSIAESLNEDGFDSPIKYKNRRSGRSCQEGQELWKKGNLSWIIHNKIYIGEWEHSVNGKKVQDQCPAIINPAVFQRAQDLYKGKKGAVSGKKAVKDNPFTGKVYPPDMKQSIGYEVGRGTDPCYKCPIGSVDGGKRIVISYEQLVRLVKEKLLLIQLEAIRIKEALGIDTKEVAILSQIQKDGENAFKALSELQKKYISVALEHTENQSSEQELTECNRRMEKQMESLQKKFEELLEKRQFIELAFSKENPWICRYSQMNIPEKLSRDFVKAYIDKIIILGTNQVRLITYDESYWLEIAKIVGCFGGVAVG